MEKELKQGTLKEILAANGDFKDSIKTWTVSYNKQADMLFMGIAFPKGSYYYPVEDSGVLLRIDENKRIYGIAIENTKLFMKENPELALPLSILVHPYRSWLYTIPTLVISHHIRKGLNQMRSIATLSDYIAGKAAYC